MRQKVAEEVRKMIQAGVIEPVTIEGVPGRNRTKEGRFLTISRRLPPFEYEEAKQCVPVAPYG